MFDIVVIYHWILWICEWLFLPLKRFVTCNKINIYYHTVALLIWYLYLSRLEVFYPFFLEGRLYTFYQFNYPQIKSKYTLKYADHFFRLSHEHISSFTIKQPWIFFTIFKCDNLTNILIIINLEKLLAGHIRIIIFDPKENMTQITTTSTEYFHFILNLLYYTIYFYFTF